MQTRSNYTTRVATTLWVRWGARALVSLLVVAVVIVGLLYALGRFGQGPGRATDGAGARPARPLFSTCQVCRDEVLGGNQPSRITPAYAEPSLDTSDPRQRGPR